MLELFPLCLERLLCRGFVVELSSNRALCDRYLKICSREKQTDQSAGVGAIEPKECDWRFGVGGRGCVLADGHTRYLDSSWRGASERSLCYSSGHHV